MGDLLLLAFWYSLIITYIFLIIGFDQYIDRKLDAEIYSEQIIKEIEELLKGVSCGN